VRQHLTAKENQMTQITATFVHVDADHAKMVEFQQVNDRGQAIQSAAEGAIVVRGKLYLRKAAFSDDKAPPKRLKITIEAVAARLKAA